MNYTFPGAFYAPCWCHPVTIVSRPYYRYASEPESLIHLDSDTPGHRYISQTFLNGWLHPDKPTPTIRQIFHIANYTQERLQHTLRFDNYRNWVGNAQTLFHGTRCECGIGETEESVRACASETCSLCKIIKGSYSMQKANNQQMFGTGIYTTEVSSKADIHVDKVGANQDKRIMIVNLVALGQSKLMYNASNSMQDAPPMYDSVTAATYAQGGRVKYHEAVVYREDAICPFAIVVYS